MGERGPAKTPASIHKRRGTYRKDRHDGPTIKGNVPKPPAGISRGAAAVWKAHAKELADADLLCDRFREPFAQWCELVAEIWEHKRTINEEGTLVETITGNVAPHPSVGMLNRARELMFKLSKQFGLNPSATTGLGNGGGVDEDDPLEQLLKKQAARQGTR